MSKNSKKVTKTSNVKAQAPKAPKAPRVQQVEKNGIVQPRAGGTTARVWDFAVKLTAKLGRTATRAEVMAVAENAGIKPGTAATQYGYWRRFMGITGRVSLPKPPKAAKAPKAPVAAPVAPVVAPAKALKAPKAPKAPVAPVAPVATAATS